MANKKESMIYTRDTAPKNGALSQLFESVPIAPVVPGASYTSAAPISSSEYNMPQYAGMANEQALGAQQELNKSLASPEEIEALRKQARDYLNFGVGQLQDVGKIDGLDASSLTHMASLVGGNPMEGVAGWAAPKNQVQQALIGDAAAALQENEYQKQRAQANFQYGAPTSLLQMQQNIADYANPLNITSMPQAQQAATIIDERLRQAEMSQKLSQSQQEHNRRMGFRPSKAYTDLYGAKNLTEGVAAPGMSKSIINPYINQPENTAEYEVYQATPDEVKANVAGNQMILDKYSAYQVGPNQPKNVDKQVNMANNTLDSIKKNGGLQNSVFKATKKVDFDPNTVFTPSEWSKFADKAGISSSGRQTVSTLLSMSDTLKNTNPEFSVYAQDVASKLASGQSIDVKTVQEHLNDMHKAYKNDYVLNKEEYNRIQSAKAQGKGLENIDPLALRGNLITNKYQALTPSQEQTFGKYLPKSVENQRQLYDFLAKTYKSKYPKASADEVRTNVLGLIEKSQGAE